MQVGENLKRTSLGPRVKGTTQLWPEAPQEAVSSVLFAQAFSLTYVTQEIPTRAVLQQDQSLQISPSLSVTPNTSSPPGIQCGSSLPGDLSSTHLKGSQVLPPCGTAKHKLSNS